MKKENSMKDYEAPSVEIVEVAVEQGFATSYPQTPIYGDKNW